MSFSLQKFRMNPIMMYPSIKRSDNWSFLSCSLAQYYRWYYCPLHCSFSFIFGWIFLINLLFTLIFVYFDSSLTSCRLRVHKNLVFALIIHSFLLLLIASPHLFNPDQSLSSYWEIVINNWLKIFLINPNMYFLGMVV